MGRVLAQGPRPFRRRSCSRRSAHCRDLLGFRITDFMGPPVSLYFLIEHGWGGREVGPGWQPVEEQMKMSVEDGFRFIEDLQDTAQKLIAVAITFLAAVLNARASPLGRNPLAMIKTRYGSR
jgi:hypothetical protein